jgi:hypothetical protein
MKRGPEKRKRLNLPFRISEEYIRLNPHDADRLRKRKGVVLYEAEDGCYVVQFEGSKSPTRYGKAYIEIIPETEETKL